jgi:ribonuclease HII
MRPDDSYEKSYYDSGYLSIAGVDEVGRGPLAGSVVAAAVMMDWRCVSEEFSQLINDSKKMTAKSRARLLELLSGKADMAIGEASVAEIETFNIRGASLLAMKRAIAGLASPPDMVLVDGRDLPDISVAAKAVIGGDGKCISIAAASVLAKQTRDQMMLDLDQQYPLYGFARHKGYPTAVHRAALKQYGVSPVHRKNFAPVARILEL